MNDTPERQQVQRDVAEAIVDLLLCPPETPKNEQQAMAARLHKQTDLGCVLVASAHIEDQLKKLIHAYFRLASTVVRETPQTNLNSVLDRTIRTFDARTNFVYSLGLIPKSTKQTLDSFRRDMRNAFTHDVSNAHTITDHVLEQVLKCLDQDRKDIISSLSDILGDKLMKPRTRFEFYILMIWTELYRATQQLARSETN